MDGVTVRRARPGDADGVYRVMRRNWVDVFSEYLHPAAVDWAADPPAAFREWFRSVRADDAKCQFVAADGDRVVGWAELSWNPEATRSFVGSEEAELAAIHVHPDRWGEGIGGELLGAVRDAVPRECTGIALKVLPDNDRARTFYERRGFEADGTTTTTIAGREYTEAVYRDRA